MYCIRQLVHARARPGIRELVRRRETAMNAVGVNTFVTAVCTAIIGWLTNLNRRQAARGRIIKTLATRRE